MKITLMNMVRIINPITHDVVILDKVKKEGREGLTFPGGKVELYESFIDSAIREVKEETNLDISNPKLIGIITWVSKDKKDVGLLYDVYEYSGKLVKENREGLLMWANYEEFKKMEGHSLSMEKILLIYDGKYSEILWDLDTNRLIYR